MRASSALPPPSPSPVSRRSFLQSGFAASLALALSSGGRRGVNLARRKVGLVTGETIAAGMEIGDACVCVAVAERTPHGVIRVLGLGRARIPKPSQPALHHSNQVDESIREALAAAEARSGVMIESVTVGVGGWHNGGLSDEGRIPQRFEQTCFFDTRFGALRGIGAKGLLASREESIILNEFAQMVEGRHRCLADLGVAIGGLILIPAAIGEAVLDASQKMRGAQVIHLGAAQTTSAVYLGGTLRRSVCLQVGCAEFKETLGHSPGAFELLGEAFSQVLQFVSGFDPGIPAQAFGAGVQLTGEYARLPRVRQLAQRHFARLGLSIAAPGGRGYAGTAALLADSQHACAIGLAKSALLHQALSFVSPKLTPERRP